jgi:hypothetical protein
VGVPMRLCSRRDEGWIMREYICWINRLILHMGWVQRENLCRWWRSEGGGELADSSLIRYSNMRGVLSI